MMISVSVTERLEDTDDYFGMEFGMVWQLSMD